MKSLLATVGAAVAAIAVSGCTSAADPAADATPSATPSASPSATSTPTPLAGAPFLGGVHLAPTVQKYSDAILTGDAMQAFGYLSSRCRTNTSQPVFAAMVAAAGQTYGAPLKFTTYHADISGDSATVSYGYEISVLDQDAQPWVREDGKWVQDAC